MIRELHVIGDAARMISDNTRDGHTEIDWRAIVGMRNRLVHGYFTVRLDVVWQTLLDDIPPLILQLERIVRKAEAYCKATSILNTPRARG